MIEVILLGPPEIRRKDGTHCPACNRSLELLAFLATRPGRGAERERIGQTLWPETPPDRQRASLSTALWRLRRALSAAGLPNDSGLRSSSERVSLGSGRDLFFDVEALFEAYRGVPGTRGRRLSEAEVARFNAAVALWRGGFLPGQDSDWAILERECLVAAHQALLDRLMEDHLAAHHWRRALDCTRALLALDPLLEHAHRAAIEAHGGLGERAQAQRQYQRCAGLLADELAVEPLPETTEALRRAMCAPGTPPDGSGARPRPTTLNIVLQDLKRATQALEHLIDGR